MIIVCLVLVIAAFVVMGTALALAELTLVRAVKETEQKEKFAGSSRL